MLEVISICDSKKRTSSLSQNTDESDVGVKMPRNDSKCSFWLSKRKRNCLTKPVIGHAYCEVHLKFADAGKLPDLSTGIVESTSNDCLQKDEDSSCTGEEKLPAPTEGHCHFWLARKRRFCKLLVIANEKFCVEHLATTEDSSSRERMPCPRDPKHSCYKDHLETHLKKCNARYDLQPEYYEKGINVGQVDGGCINNKASIKDLEKDEIMSIVNTVCLLHAEHVRELETSELRHPTLIEEISNPKNGVVAQKHLVQQASLVGNLEALGLLRDGIDYMEFGAGKGGLSHWVQIANAKNSNTQYILVDRSSCRYKKDNYHKGSDQGPSFQRVKIDIENLNIAKVPAIKQSDRPLVGIGKHLCGSATDLMLRCLAETADASAEDIFPRRVEGIALALCCHHRCDWKSYVGKSWFLDRGLDIRQFQLIVSMSAWATCTHRSEIDKLSHGVDVQDYCHPRYGHLDAVQRETIGIKCKQLIDKGRLHYLTERGFDAKLVYYVQRSLTLENVALTATQNRKSTVGD